MSTPEQSPRRRGGLLRWVLLAVVLLPFVLLLARPAARWQVGRVVLAAYAGWLLLTGLLQNMADTATYGFTWVLGNSVVSLIVAGFFEDKLDAKLLYEKIEEIAQSERDGNTMVQAIGRPMLVGGIVKQSPRLAEFVADGGYTAG